MSATRRPPLPSLPPRLAGKSPETWDDDDWAEMSVYLFRMAEYESERELLDEVQPRAVLRLLHTEHRSILAAHQATLVLLRLIAVAVDVDVVQSLRAQVRRLEEENLRLRMDRVDP